MSGLMLSIFMFMVTAVRAQSHVKADGYPSSAFAKMNLKPAGTTDTKRFNINVHIKYTLFVFLSPECPLSQQYTLPLNQIVKSYNENVTVIGIFPGKSYDQRTINSFLKKYKIGFDSYIDES